MRRREGREEEAKGERERERARSRTKETREFDAPLLSVDGTVIAKAVGASPHWSDGEVDVIVSIAGPPRDDQTFLRLFFSLIPRSRSVLVVLGAPCVPVADSRPVREKHKDPRLRSPNQEATCGIPARVRFLSRQIAADRDSAVRGCGEKNHDLVISLYTVLEDGCDR